MEVDSTAAADSQSAAAAAASSSSSGAAPKKRKLVSGSSDADDAGDAGDQAASSDAEGGDGDDSDSASRKKKQKKAKRPGAQFIDDIAINEDDEEEEDEEEDDDEEEEEDNGDGEADDGEDLMDERVRRRDDAEGASDDESPAQRKARKKAEKLARKGGKAGRSRVDIGNEDDTMHMSLDQIREQNEAKALVEKFEKRYEDRGGNYDYEYDEEGANGRSSGAVLPSIRDPSLFLLKCEPGHENEVCWMLMQQFYKREADRDESQRFQIFSVFTTPASKGYIYVEADRETHVESAIKSLPIRGLVKYYRSSKQNCKVPLAEMVAALKFKTEEASVELKQWVRMKRGPYKDDLAQVVRMQDQGTLITVKLIPRIDFLFLDAKRDNDKLTRAQFKAQSSSAAARRPQQKLFDRREIERNYTPAPERKRGGVNDKNTYYWDFMGQKFKNGFYYKEMKIDALVGAHKQQETEQEQASTQTTHVNPLADELERFSSRTYQSDEDDEEEEKNEEKDVALIAAEAAALSGSHRKVLFSPNDRVQVTAGGMKDVTGRVLSIKGDTLTIRPDDARLGPNFDEMAAHVRKYFTVGAHVKVVSGILKGETGMISCVFEEEDQLAIYLDSGVRAGGDPKVSAQDVIESSEVSTGRESFGSFELGDLVQLSGDMVATIIKINMSDMTVLTSLGNVLQPKLQEIRFKRQDRFARTMDKLNHTVEIGDIVQCMSGPQRGKSATVKHIVKKTLFLHNRELPDNGGLFIMQGGQVLLMMGDGSQATTGQAPKSPSHGSRSPGPAPRSPGGNNPASSAAGGAARVGPIRRDPIIGKEVKINGGMYKNYVGMCKDVQGGQARVEIRAVFRTISIARNQITEIERAAARFAEMAGRHPMYGGATPLVGGATPAHSGFGSATPGHEFGGSQTPFGAGGSRTPSHRTPSHSDSHGGDVWAPQTPAHRQEDRPAPEEDDEEEWRTGMQDAEMRTPGANPTTPGGVPQTPRTPGVNTPYEAPHDVDMDMQTPATPGAGAGAAAAAAAEPEPEPEPEEEVVAGLFTRPAFLGCFVTLAGSGSEAQYTIVGLEDGGRSVRLKPHASGGALKTVEQRDLQPVHPDKSEKDVPAMFLSAVSSKSGAYEAGERTKVMSVYGENVLITSGSDDDADMLALAQLQQLCKCDAGQAAAAAEGEEEEAPAAASKSKGKKKSKVKSEKKR